MVVPKYFNHSILAKDDDYDGGGGFCSSSSSGSSLPGLNWTELKVSELGWSIFSIQWHALYNVNMWILNTLPPF